MEARRKGQGGDLPGRGVELAAGMNADMPAEDKDSEPMRRAVATTVQNASPPAFEATAASSRLLAHFEELIDWFCQEPTESRLASALHEIDEMSEMWRRNRRADLFLARITGSGILHSLASQRLYAYLREWGEPRFKDHTSALDVAFGNGAETAAVERDDSDSGFGD